MEDFSAFREEKRHGEAGFDFNIYPCTIPSDFPRVAVHWQNGMELLFIKRGRGLVQTGTTQQEAVEGDIFIFTPGTLHGIRADGDHRMEYENFLFALDLLSGSEDVCTERYLIPLYAGRLGLPARLRPGEEGYDTAVSCLRHIEEANRIRWPGYELVIKGMLMCFLGVLIGLRGEVPRVETADSRRLNLLLHWLEANYADRLTVADAAALCGLSESHFMRWFKQTTNYSFTTYLNDYRLLRAAESLRQTDNTILSIAGQHGFENLSYFNRQFKKYFGVTPGEYRAHHLTTSTAYSTLPAQELPASPSLAL